MFAPRTPRTAGGGVHGAEEKSLSFALRATEQSTVQLQSTVCNVVKVFCYKRSVSHHGSLVAYILLLSI